MLDQISVTPMACYMCSDASELDQCCSACLERVQNESSRPPQNDYGPQHKVRDFWVCQGCDDATLSGFDNYSEYSRFVDRGLEIANWVDSEVNRIIANATQTRRLFTEPRRLFECFTDSGQISMARRIKSPTHEWSLVWLAASLLSLGS